MTIINFLGFLYYSIYTAGFLYSPMIRMQYAARYSTEEEPTVRFNDLAFAVHAVLLCALMYTQFWPSIWGFAVSRFQRISKTMAGLFWGSILAPLIIVWIVLARSPDGGYDPSSWAWIDVVSVPGVPKSQPGFSCDVMRSLDIFILVRQGPHHRFQVCASGVDKLQETVDRGLEHLHNSVGFGRRHPLAAPTGAGLESSERLEWHHRQPS